MKKLLISIGAVLTLLLIVIVGLIAYVLTFDANENKDWIAQKFMERTGRELVLGGDIDITIYPWAGITADNVSIGNAPGFSATPLLQVEHLETRIKLMPMLNGEYEIDTVRLHGARANLEVLGNGQNNWTLGNDTTEGDVADESSSSGGTSTNLIIGGVDIQDAALVYDDQFANTHYEVSNLDLSIGELVYGAPLDVRLSLDATSRAPELAVTTTVAGTVLYDVDNGRYDLAPLQLDATLRGPNVPTGSAALKLTTALTVNVEEDTLSLRDLEFDALDSHLSAGLEVARASTATPAVTGNVNLTGDDLAVIFRILEQEELAQRIGTLASNFAVTANIDADLADGTLEVPELYIAAVGATISGNVHGTRIQTDTPQVSGQLNAQGPDLPLLMQIVGPLLGGRESALNQTGLQLREGVQNRAFTLSTDFDADLEAGNVQLPALNATLVGFTVSGRLDAKDINNGGNIDGAFTLQGSNLREVLTALDQPDLAEVAQSINVNVKLGGSSDNLRISPLNVELVLSGAEIPNSPQTLALNADTALNLDDDSLSVDNFTLSGLGLNLTGNVAATNIQENAAFTGRIEVPAFNARRLLEQLNQPVTTADATVLQSVAFTSAFTGTSNSLNVDNLALTLDQSKLTGSLALTDLATMSGRFTVNIDSIDADRYLNPTVEETTAEPAPAEPLPVDTLKTLNIQGAVNIGQLTISGLHMNDIVVELSAANGKIALNPIRANLYQGSFAGDIGLDVTGAEPVATVNTQLSTIALGPMVMDFMDANYLIGTGNITLALTGRGIDSTAIKSSLTGIGELGVTDGVLQGVDVDAVLRTVETMIRNQRVQPLPQGGTTAFEQFAGALAIDKGVVGSNNLAIKAKGWNVMGTGILADLTNDTIDFDLITTVDETPASDGQPYDLGGYSLPIACTGALAAPRCLPDAQQIIAGAIRGAVQRRLGDLLQDRLGTGTQQEATPDPNQATEAPAPAEEEQKPEAELLNRAIDLLRR